MRRKLEPTVNNRVDMFMPLLVVILSFAAYVLTAAPLITAGDAGELVAAMYSLGVTHPPGYPLFALTGKAASFIPLGDVAFRANILTAFWSSLCALMVYLTARLVSGGGSAVVAASFALAASACGTVWGIATEAEVYSLSIFLSLLSLYLILSWSEGDDNRLLYLSSFVLALAVSAHYSAAVFMPPVLLGVLLSGRARVGLRGWFLSATFFMLGLSVFLYLAVRAAAMPPVNWGAASGLTAFIAHVTRATYGDLGAFNIMSAAGQAGMTTGVFGSGTLAMLGLAVLAVVSAVVVMKRRGMDPKPVALVFVVLLFLGKLTVGGIDLYKLSFLVSLIGERYWWPVLAASATGLVLVYRHDRGRFYVLLFLMACMTVVFVYRVPNDTREYMTPLGEKFFAVWFMMTAALGGAGVSYVLERLRRSGSGPYKLAGFGLVLATAGFALFLGVAGFGSSDRTRLYWPRDYSANMMRSIGQGALFLTEGDHHPFYVIYQQVVENARPDVIVLESVSNIFPDYSNIEKVLRSRPGAPVFCTQEAEVNPFPGVVVEQMGVVNRWAGWPANLSDPVERYVFRAEMEDVVNSDYMARSVYANYNYHMARRLLRKGDPAGAREYLDKALKGGEYFVWLWVNVGNIELSQGWSDLALRRYEQALKLAPGCYLASLNVGDIYMQRGDMTKAREAYLGAVKYAGWDAEAYMQVAKTYEAEGDRDKAVRYWRKYITKRGANKQYGLEKIRELGGYN